MENIRILLAGASGHMGQEVIKAVAARNDMTVVAGLALEAKTIDGIAVFETAEQVKQSYDVLIDFSNPALLPEIVKLTQMHQKPLVVATTGFTAAEQAALDTLSADVALFQSANMSVGVNLMAHLATIAAKALYPEFDIEIVEAHHRRKKDAPSGTAILLADAIRDSLADQADMDLVYDRSQRQIARPTNEIGVSVVRGGNIVGEHDIYFAGSGEVLTLKHSALSRRVFADGALKAARFILSKTAEKFSMNDLFTT